jgi:hypothetical protein
MARMRPATGEVLHFSEDPTITRFVPHVAATAQQSEAFVWAVDAGLAPAYWFPRDCPRAMAWVTPGTKAEDREHIIGPGGGTRVHAIEHAWLAPMLTVELYGYRLPAEAFRPFGDPVPHAFVATMPVTPLGPAEPVGDLIDLHRRAGIQIRILPRIGTFWEAVIGSTLGFSGIRLHNAGHGPPNTDLRPEPT